MPVQDTLEKLAPEVSPTERSTLTRFLALSAKKNLDAKRINEHLLASLALAQRNLADKVQ